MKKFGLRFYSILYFLGLFSFVVNSITTKYTLELLTILTNIIGFLTIFAIPFTKQ